MVDVTKFHSTQHDVQKDAWKTNDLQISQRKEKQIDYILIKRRHMKYSEDAGANDMIHMGIDHRCVMATFVFNTPKKDGTCRTKNDTARRSRTTQSVPRATWMWKCRPTTRSRPRTTQSVPSATLTRRK